MKGTFNYEENYARLPFEDVLREFRVKKLVDTIMEGQHAKILEIGCGFNPLFKYFDHYESMIVVEPSIVHCNSIRGNSDSRVLIVNKYIEEVGEDEIGNDFDFIVIGGFLHEIDSPEVVLKRVLKHSRRGTRVYSYVPNANSFHRLLAERMGLISNIHEMSTNDKLFSRRVVFDQHSFVALFEVSGYQISKTGTYFIKPFAHDQMAAMMKYKIGDMRMMEGLDKMIDVIPGFGAEIFVLATTVSV